MSSCSVCATLVFRDGPGLSRPSTSLLVRKTWTWMPGTSPGMTEAGAAGGLTMVKTRPFDAAEVLDSPEMIAAWLTEAFGSDDPALMARVIGAVARSQGMAAVAGKAGLSRENLYRALGGDARPE